MQSRTRCPAISQGAVSALQRVALGQTATAGRATIEAEVLDSQTGERVAALVDGRAGRKVTGRFDKWKKWQDVRDACDFWSGSLRAVLAAYRAVPD